jgi:tellurite resistance protein TerC
LSNVTLWVVIAVAIAICLALDFFVFGRRGITTRSAAIWSVGWLVVGLGFTFVIWAVDDSNHAAEYATGYVIERSLSLDNLFVFALIFAAMGITGNERLRLLALGIVVALVLRAGAIAGGAALLDLFHVTLYVFGALLVLTGIKLAKRTEVEIEPDRSLAVRALRRVYPAAGPTAAAIAMIAATDVVFAIDSIPAIFAVTDDPLIVFAANAFALVGLRSLYVLLADLLKRFVYLDLGLAAILVFVGAKMLLVDVWKVPIWLSLVVIIGILGLATIASHFAVKRGVKGHTIDEPHGEGTHPEPKPKPA